MATSTKTAKAKEYTPEELKEILAQHRLWLDTRWTGNVQGICANLVGANLRYAVLTRANLVGANLVGANLDGANLDGANLRYAVLTRANLVGANLVGANLDGANLVGANLVGANLVGANLDGANLDNSKVSDETRLPGTFNFKEYVEVVVPALCVAGGKSLDDVANPKVWNCHSWENCPMAEAFDVHSIGDVPALYRPIANFFVQMFDAHLLPLGRVNPKFADQVDTPAACEVKA